MARDHYYVLGVSPSATGGQIEEAFRRLVRELMAGYDVGASLLDLEKAFSVLADPSRRRSYDERFQKVPIASGGRPAAEPLVPAEAAAGSIGDVSLSRSFRTFGPSREEIQDRLWSNFTLTSRPKAETVEQLSVDVPITPEQAMSGGTVRVLVPAVGECRVCGGFGGVGPYTCVNCDGRGVVVDEYPVMVSFPAGYSSYTQPVRLDHLGIRNFYLAVHFRLTHEPIS